MELLRKRAEHNECEITTLEEISLHQQDLERWVQSLHPSNATEVALYLGNAALSQHNLLRDWPLQCPFLA